MFEQLSTSTAWQVKVVQIDSEKVTHTGVHTFTAKPANVRNIL